MVAASPLLAVLYLLAAAPGNKGRQRYAPKRSTKRKRAPNRQPPNAAAPKEDPLPPPPPPTDPSGPFPTYFTCRHTYEDTLMEELHLEDPSLVVTLPYLGLVRVESDGVPRDLVYALQTLPNCRIVEVSNSIKGLAKAISEIPDFGRLLQEAPKGSLVIHALVPGMCKGQREPKLQRRAYLVTDALMEMSKKRFPAARKSQTPSEESLLLLQVMLLSPDIAAASLSTCSPLNDFTGMVWPNPNLPVGLANVDIDVKMPSSAYRKLLEAFSCWQYMPTKDDVVVDLGASPGGWTYAVLLHCQPQKIVAVDRAELDPTLMSNPVIEFVQGDAFAYRPPEPVDWMISDIIAYPERIIELLETWCSNTLAKFMVVTVKFQGETPSWGALQEAMVVARSHNYRARAKHFFNNKNEVTLMLQHKDTIIPSCESSSDMIRGPIYDRAWPKE